jgi:hypothetical protein
MGGWAVRKKVQETTMSIQRAKLYENDIIAVLAIHIILLQLISKLEPRISLEISIF